MSEKLIENNVKWNNFIVMYDQFGVNEECVFEISPRDFLKYADEDLKKYDNINKVHKAINITTNAKRAIDCQIDWIIRRLGYDLKNFDKNDIINKFIKQKSNGDCVDGENKKLNFINLLGLSPKILIAKYRYIRNKLEHEYKKISIEEAKEILELAEFFINATDYKVEYDFASSFSIHNLDNTITYNIYVLAGDIINSKIKIRSVVNENSYEKEISSNESLYTQMLSAFLNKQYKQLPKLFGYDILEECVNVRINY